MSLHPGTAKLGSDIFFSLFLKGLSSLIFVVLLSHSYLPFHSDFLMVHLVTQPFLPDQPFHIPFLTQYPNSCSQNQLGLSLHNNTLEKALFFSLIL